MLGDVSPVIYINCYGLVDFGEDDSYVSKVAISVEEAQKLIEAGFEYVCENGWSKDVQKEGIVKY